LIQLEVKDGFYDVRIVDCGSANGTLINSFKIKERVLKNGDIVVFGGGGTCPLSTFVPHPTSDLQYLYCDPFHNKRQHIEMKNPPCDWSTDEVLEWMENIIPEYSSRYRDIFEKLGIDGEGLLSLSKEEIDNLFSSEKVFSVKQKLKLKINELKKITRLHFRKQ